LRRGISQLWPGLTAPDGTLHRFEVDPFRKQALLKGQDEIALTMEYEQAIAATRSGAWPR